MISTQNQRDAFIAGWYEELVALGRVTAKTAQTMTRKLQSGIRRPDLARLAGNPLLLTIMAIVHTHKRRLPEGRAQLYDETIEILLWRWEEVKLNGKAPRVKNRWVKPSPCPTCWPRRDACDSICTVSWPASLFRFISRFGRRMTPTKWPMWDLAQLYQALCALHPQQDHGWAQKVVQVMRLRAGLLIEKDIGKFSFPHRTFQEYLAGCI
jgi:predicted NACHT family NTPase